MSTRTRTRITVRDTAGYVNLLYRNGFTDGTRL